MKTFPDLRPLRIYATGLLFSFLLISGCSKNNKSTSHTATVMPAGHAFAKPIEQAHKMDAWEKMETLKTNINLQFGGEKALNATLFVQTNGPGIRLEISKDTLAVSEGQQMWVTPSDTAIGPFQLKVWAYFLEAPYKLDDPGTSIKSQEPAQMNGKTYDTAKLTFSPGTGDSPDDWFILYRNRDSNRLNAMAYIVTYGKTVQEASKNPHAISYGNFKTVNGIPIATTWKFWHWNAQQGFSNQPIGQAQLTNIQFVKTGNLYSKPKGAMKMKQPKK